MLHNELDWIFSLHAQRKLSKNLTFQYKNRKYQLTEQGKGYRLRGAQVTVCEAFDGSVILLYRGRALPHRILGEGEPPIPLDETAYHHLSSSSNLMPKRGHFSLGKKGILQSLKPSQLT